MPNLTRFEIVTNDGYHIICTFLGGTGLSVGMQALVRIFSASEKISPKIAIITFSIGTILYLQNTATVRLLAKKQKLSIYKLHADYMRSLMEPVYSRLPIEYQNCPNALRQLEYFLPMPAAIILRFVKTLNWKVLLAAGVPAIMIMDGIMDYLDIFFPGLPLSAKLAISSSLASITIAEQFIYFGENMSEKNVVRLWAAYPREYFAKLNDSTWSYGSFLQSMRFSVNWFYTPLIVAASDLSVGVLGGLAFMKRTGITNLLMKGITGFLLGLLNGAVEINTTIASCLSREGLSKYPKWLIALTAILASAYVAEPLACIFELLEFFGIENLSLETKIISAMMFATTIGYSIIRGQTETVIEGMHYHLVPGAQLNDADTNDEEKPLASGNIQGAETYTPESTAGNRNSWWNPGNIHQNTSSNDSAYQPISQIKNKFN